MKKILLLAAFAVASLGLSAADGVTITPSLGDDGETPSFSFSSSNDYYLIYLGEETKGSYGADVPEANYIYIGPDADNGRNLWVWSDTFTAPTTDGVNSFGVPGEYMAWEVGSVGWSGLGYNIAAANPIDVSGVKENYTFHFAVKSTSTETFDFEIIDGNGHEAHIVLGKSAYEGHAAVGDFERDGEWYNVDVPLSYLADQFEFDLSTATSYADVNYFVLLAGGVKGTRVDYDAVMYYGPHSASAINAATAGEKATTGKTYNLCGQAVAADYKGVVVRDGRKFINK